MAHALEGRRVLARASYALVPALRVGAFELVLR